MPFLSITNYQFQNAPQRPSSSLFATFVARLAIEAGFHFRNCVFSWRRFPPSMQFAAGPVQPAVTAEGRAVALIPPAIPTRVLGVNPGEGQ